MTFEDTTRHRGKQYHVRSKNKPEEQEH